MIKPKKNERRALIQAIDTAEAQAKTAKTLCETRGERVLADTTLKLARICRLLLARADARPTPGICSQCGCTDLAACDGGCCWVDLTETLCSSCVTPDDEG